MGGNMILPLPENNDLVCYFVVKHSWKGKYKRIFSVGTQGITTYNPNSLEVTNRWPYSDIISIKALPQGHEFAIHMKKEKDGKKDSMRFSTEYRSQLLSDALKYRHLFDEKPQEILKYEAFKHHWSGTKLPIVLEVTPYSLDQLDTATNQLLASYCFYDIECIRDVSDVPTGFVVVCKYGRMHFFSCHKKEDIKKKMQEAALYYLNDRIDFSANSILDQEVVAQRFGQFSGDEHITSMAEFTVSKVQNNRHSESQRRLLCLSETCILERDVQTYSIVTLRPLSDIFALIRDPSNPQLFTIEYINGSKRSYNAPNRDSLLASLMDSVRASGNRDVHIKMNFTDRGKRLSPFSYPVDEEVETSQLKFLHQPPSKKSFNEIIERFNCNIPYSGLLYSVTQDGLFTENKDKLIILALQSVLIKEGDQTEISNSELEAQFQALRRLVASKIGFSAFTTLNGFREGIGVKVVRALKRENEAITHAAVDMICALMHPMHDDCDLRQEQLNKSSLLSTQKFLEQLLDMWMHHVNCGTGALVVSVMLDFLTFALCIPYSETTEGKHFDALLEMVAERGRSLFKHFQHPSLTVIKGAGLVMRALIEEGEASVATRMQELALSEGALPCHLLTALYSSDSDSRLLAHRQLSRHLVGLWVTDNPKAMELLRRIMPSGLLGYLESDESVPIGGNEDALFVRDNLKLAQDHAAQNRRNPHIIAIEKRVRLVEKQIELALLHWGVSRGFERKEDKLKDKPIALRKRRERVKSVANWNLFYYKFAQDHSLPNLIWNHKTREELKESLENEIRLFKSDCEIARHTLMAWNHHEFEVPYRCLQGEVCIDGYYLRILLEKNDAPETLFKQSQAFFNNLYHKFLLNSKTEMRSMCLQAMAIVYGRFYEQIGFFSDTSHIINMLDKTFDRTERDRLLFFIDKLILNRDNIKSILDANGVKILVDLLTLAHLHTSRAVMPTQTNVIEAGQDMLNKDNEKEWHYGTLKESKGPITFQELQELWVNGTINPKTKFWAQGMDGWASIHHIPQLKWCLLAKGQSVMNESELASLVLSILIKIVQYFPGRNEDGAVIWPIPRVKRLLSAPQCLPHIVQLLLTFDPVLVEKVASLLCEVAVDNSHTSKLYLTGVFFFILMYTGSNVLPIAKFLQLTHTKQAFRALDEAPSSELMQRSVLGPLLPEAMVYYLENHGAAKFAQIFLGEFDTPEAIWNAEMRRLLIEKIALHIADFSPRLKGNNRAMYHYCGIPAVRYPQLDNELFCNIFYLRHLCDSLRFPDWPIKHPVQLLKDVLEAWKAEVEKKPPEMSVDDAYEALGLKRGEHHPEPTIRKAYYKLAQLYHPDKNPGGREKFVLANKAYDFLCSRNSWLDNGPNPNNIVLILQTQSILFGRYSSELQPYKYAGYKQLIKTIRLETADVQLFSKSTMILTAASELAYHTVNCSALNAEELNREHGFNDLLDAFSRCASVLSQSSKPNDMAVNVCLHCTRCFSVAAQFTACRESFIKMPQLISDLVRVLTFKNLPKLCSEVVDCIGSFAGDARLQSQLLKTKILWHLISFLFNYDFTLEECGVERSEEANNQEVWNKLAKTSVKALARLGGYLSGQLASPENPQVQGVLSCLLTPFLAQKFRDDEPEELLKLLTSNSETPYLVWNNTTRAELNDFLEQRMSIRGEETLQKVELGYSSHANELIIGNIFIRVYNNRPTFVIQDPKKFILDLLTYIKANIPKSHQPADTQQLTNVCMALHALNNIILNNPGLEIQCIGHFDLLFSLLYMDNYRLLQDSALTVISTLTRNHECVNDISGSDILVYLLLALYSLPDQYSTSVEIMYALATNSNIVKTFLSKGGYLYLLNILCNSNDVNIRIKVAELFGRLCSDKLSGPRIRLTLGQFLPAAICDAMRDAPPSCIQLLESNQENPELVWDANSRKHVFGTVSQLAKQHYTKQRMNPMGAHKIPDPGPLLKDAVNSNEIVVGGVYLRLFNANPGWNLRKPKEFLTELLDNCLSLMTKDEVNFEMLNVMTTAVVNLLQAQPNLADQVPALGHIPRICLHLNSTKSVSVPKSVIRILHQLALSEVCVWTLSQTDCLGPMKKAMSSYSELINISCETLSRIFSAKKDTLVKQALDVQLIPFLLELLGGRLDGCDNAAQTKALIVKALKTMMLSLAHGNTVISLLDRSPVWASYRDQNHDLFITNAPSNNYLTSGVPTTAGYLTQGDSQQLPTMPPPLDREDR
ncbi:unnamed protein product [Bemisia tabaci]|uniref:J domain-containing protein n=1 Tax=Bemisia tabaci TaxID=7038 RepID=A0A9P0CGL1_BEMTA|nr:unnamed protein product [Bemisia tabaci]